MKTLIAAVAVCLAGLSVLAQSPTEQAEEALDRYLVLSYLRSPVWMEKYVDDKVMAGRLQSESPESYKEHYANQRELLGRLAAIDRERLADDLRLSVDLVVYKLALSLDGETLKREQMPVTSIGGPQYWLPQLARFSKLQTPRDHDLYIARLSDIPRLLEETTAQMRLGMEAGRVPPRVIIEPAIRQAQAQIVSSARLSPFYEPFRDRPVEDEQAARALTIINTGIIPAYDAFARFLENEYLPACRESFG
ncbi:MAG: DUF885 family protein, partial [Planctomycetota bacterium]